MKSMDVAFNPSAGLDSMLKAMVTAKAVEGAGTDKNGIDFGVSFSDVLKHTAKSANPVAAAVVNGKQLAVAEKDENAVDEREAFISFLMSIKSPIEEKLTDEQAEALVDMFIKFGLGDNGKHMTIQIAEGNEETLDKIKSVYARKAAEGPKYLQDYKLDEMFLLISTETNEDPDLTKATDDFIKALKKHFEKLQDGEQTGVTDEEVTGNGAKDGKGMGMANASPMSAIDITDTTKFIVSDEDYEYLRISSSFQNGIPEEEEFENRTTVPEAKELTAEEKFLQFLMENKQNMTGANGIVVTDATEQVSIIKGDGLNSVKVESPVMQKTLDEQTANLVHRQVTEKLLATALQDTKNGVKEMTIILKPEELGEIAVKITTEDGKMSILMAAQYESVGNAVNDRAATLADALARQNIDVKDIKVIDPTDASSQMGLDFTNQGFNRENYDGYREMNGLDYYYGETKGAGDINSEPVIDEKQLHENIQAKEAALWARA